MKLTLLLCLFVTGIVAADIPLHVATIPIPRQETECLERHESFNAISRKGEAKLVFLGDSITQLWDAEDTGKPVWEKYWAPLKAANFGISADRTEHVLWRLDHGNLDGLKPKLIVVLIGTNNTIQQEPNGYKCTAEQTADGIKAIIERLKIKCPTSKILLMGIFPCQDENEHPFRIQNEATNTVIKNYADEKTVFFMDIGKKFMNSYGNLNVMNMPDMLHPSGEGYKIWAESIAPTVRKLMQ